MQPLRNFLEYLSTLRCNSVHPLRNFWNTQEPSDAIWCNFWEIFLSRPTLRCNLVHPLRNFWIFKNLQLQPGATFSIIWSQVFCSITNLFSEFDCGQMAHLAPSGFANDYRNESGIINILIYKSLGRGRMQDCIYGGGYASTLSKRSATIGWRGAYQENLTKHASQIAGNSASSVFKVVLKHWAF